MGPLQLPPAPNTPEALARESIDDQLIACGWVVQDYKAADFSAGRGIALREVPLTTGPCDYLLLVDRTPLGVIEAKKQGTTLSAVADQSARYANSLPDFLAAGSSATIPFLYESTVSVRRSSSPIVLDGDDLGLSMVTICSRRWSPFVCR